MSLEAVCSMRQKLLLLLLTFGLAIPAWVPCLGQFRYMLNEDGESYTIFGDEKFSGELIIPSVAEFDGLPITGIGVNAFKDFTEITSLVIPNSVINIGTSAFRNCSSLTSVSMGNSVTTMGEQIFRDCTSLKYVKLPDSLTTWDRSCFYNCLELESVDLPNSITEIPLYTFRDCQNLTSVEIPNSVTEICGWAFDGCSSLSSLNIPETVTVLGAMVFNKCTNLTSIEIPNHVTSLARVFEDCKSLESVILGYSVMEMSVWTFRGCESLKSIICRFDTPFEAPEDSFDDSTYSIATLYVPAGHLDEFKQKVPWSNFVNIIEEDVDEVENVDIEDASLENCVPYAVYDLNGQKVGTSVNGLTNGIYFIRHNTSVKKIVIK